MATYNNDNNDNNDTIIVGSSANDSIYNSGGNCVSISGGAGNDLISLSGDYYDKAFIQYNAGDGNDTIEGLNSDDTLKITGAEFTSVASGSDLIISFGND